MTLHTLPDFTPTEREEIVVLTRMGGTYESMCRDRFDLIVSFWDTTPVRRNRDGSTRDLVGVDDWGSGVVVVSDNPKLLGLTWAQLNKKASAA